MIKLFNVFNSEATCSWLIFYLNKRLFWHETMHYQGDLDNFWALFSNLSQYKVTSNFGHYCKHILWLIFLKKNYANHDNHITCIYSSRPATFIYLTHNELCHLIHISRSLVASTVVYMNLIIKIYHSSWYMY